MSEPDDISDAELRQLEKQLAEKFGDGTVVRARKVPFITAAEVDRVKQLRAYAIANPLVEEDWLKQGREPVLDAYEMKIGVLPDGQWILGTVFTTTVCACGGHLGALLAIRTNPVLGANLPPRDLVDYIAQIFEMPDGSACEELTTEKGHPFVAVLGDLPIPPPPN